ncbi:ATP-binding protein [Catellatospora methionotrophica]|uniref:ATP-binding protein n=1 Tax=Catellatospora methionotrophica TaxID=121620 RepID=UPI0033F27145
MAGLPKPALDGAIGVLFDELHRLHHRAGWPSLRDMAREVGCSHTTVSAAFSEARLPRWGLLELIVEALDGDTAQFHRLWLAASRPPADPGGDATASTIPQTLPADIGGFVGRGEQLAALDQTLARATAPGGTATVICALSGTAGAGKTALAVHWAHRVAARFPDGQLYINLRGYDPDHPVPPDQALEFLLAQLGVARDAIPAGVAARAARLRSALAGRRTLLLLDNAHSLAQLRELLPGSPGCFVLVTSRDRLPSLSARHGAVRLAVDVLSPTEALELLQELVGVRVEAQPAAAAALAQRCARLPLAVRIAAELAAARPHDTLPELVAELDREPGLLDLLDMGDEHAAVRSVLSWSLRHLSPDDARCFALLGLHPGQDLGLGAAAALCGADPGATLRTVTALTRAHLLEQYQRDRYTMHDLLRAYAGELGRALPAADREAARDRLHDHYLALARDSVRAAYDPTADQAAARRVLDLDRANMINAAAYGAPHHTRGLAASLTRHLETCSHFHDALTLAALDLAAARAQHDAAAVAGARCRLGAIHRRLGDYARGLEHYAAALDQYTELSDDAGKAAAVLGVGSSLWRLGRYTDALDVLRTSLAWHQGLGDRPGQAATLNHLGIVHRRLGQYRDARAHYGRALAIQVDLGNVAGQANARANLGIVQLRLGDYGHALDNFQQALAVYRELGDRAGEAAVLNNIGETRERLGDFTLALEHHRLALDINRAVGYRVGHAVALRGLGVALGGLRLWPEAVDHLERALALGTAIAEADILTCTLTDLGAILHEMGQSARAREQLTRALDLAGQTGNDYERARALAGLARTADPADAGGYATQARELFHGLGVAEAHRPETP